MRGKYAETFPTSCARKGKTKQKKKRQNAGSPYLLYGLIEGITRFKGKDYKEERGEGRGGGCGLGHDTV